jgi:hypothetical protein
MPIIQVPGQIASSIATQTGKGLVKIWEKTSFKGQEKYVLWTCWFDVPQLHLGEHDEVIIDGRMSTKIGSYEKDGETKTVVEHHLNDAGIVKHNPTTSVSQDVRDATSMHSADLLGIDVPF